MSIVVEAFGEQAEFAACEAVQEAVCGPGARTLLTVPMLVAVHRSGGMVLGAYDDTDPTPTLSGCLVDLVAEGRDRTARLTGFHGVLPGHRGRGIGYRQRCRERELLLEAGTTVVRWAIDPLRSAEAYFALNKLGAVGIAYERDLYGRLDDVRNRGLATDRLVVEWRLDAPRVCALVDREAAPYHFQLGLEGMEVVSKTASVAGSRLRRLQGFADRVGSDVVLAEIPEDLDRLRLADADLARDWRTGTRDLFETFIGSGYTVTGFVHQGGRSFHLLERADRGTILDRADEDRPEGR